MNLSDLKLKSVPELLKIAGDMGIEHVSRTRKQDIIFAILKTHAKSGEDIYGDGVLEILQDGFGFLRSANSSYLAGPDFFDGQKTHLNVNLDYNLLDLLESLRIANDVIEKVEQKYK